MESPDGELSGAARQSSRRPFRLARFGQSAFRGVAWSGRLGLTARVAGEGNPPRARRAGRNASGEPRLARYARGGKAWGEERWPR